MYRTTRLGYIVLVTEQDDEFCCLLDIIVVVRVEGSIEFLT